MKRAWLAMLFLVLVCASAAPAQTPAITTDVLGSHDFGSTASPVHGGNANACSYCHTPHNGLSTTPLWNQTLSATPSYTTYTSPTAKNVTTQPQPGKTSTLCLSCHDGTVAVGQTVSSGTLQMTGTLTSSFGSQLQRSHPFSLVTPIQDAVHLVPTLAASQTLADPTNSVKLIDGNIECNTCHDVHNQYKDPKSRSFLVRDNANGQLCLACHTTSSRTLNGRDNPLATWPTGVHATSTAQIQTKAGLGTYANLKETACIACHATHNSTGAGLLRASTRVPNADGTSQTCFTCHDGSDNMAQPLRNVAAEVQKATSHPFADTSNPHTLNEAIKLDNNRHATCGDCHNGHAAATTTTFTTTAALRPSQTGVSGVTATGTVLTTAANQFENCLRCHGASAGKQSLARYGYMPARTAFAGDVLNVALEFSATAVSAHPVMRDRVGGSQPSLLPGMYNVGFTAQTRVMTNRILCTDCHNSDNNREFGGTGPNGPHGSANDHLLERRYVMSQVPPPVAGNQNTGPGSRIINPTPNPVLTGNASPFALCAKCHNLQSIANNTSFSQHSRHMQKNGFSCSTCHSAHGVPAGSAGVSGQRLVTFDRKVVAPNTLAVPTYNAGTCNLTCHAHKHK